MSEPTPEAAIDPAIMTPPARGKILPILLALNSVLLLGVLGAVLLRDTIKGEPKKAESAASAPAEEAHGGGGNAAPVAVAMLKLSDFVIRLRNPEIDRFARITFELEVGSDAEKERLTPHLPKIRDAFISYLSDRTLEELRGSDGLTTTKQALLDRLPQLVPQNTRIRNLYVTEFVIQ